MIKTQLTKKRRQKLKNAKKSTQKSDCNRNGKKASGKATAHLINIPELNRNDKNPQQGKKRF